MTTEEQKIELIQDLLEIVRELGWNVAIPQTDDNEEVPGMIIGEPGYVNETTAAVDYYEEENGDF